MASTDPCTWRFVGQPCSRPRHVGSLSISHLSDSAVRRFIVWSYACLVSVTPGTIEQFFT